VSEEKEPIPEIDEEVGVEDIKIQPGTEVWHKVYSKVMLVIVIHRDIYSKELEYGLTYMTNNKEIHVSANAYSLIPLEQRIEVYTDGKVGPTFRESDVHRQITKITNGFFRHGGSTYGLARTGVRG